MLSLTLPQFVGLYNIFVGLMLTLSILLMGAGIVVWLVRLGTSPTYRDDALIYMQWAIAILFTVTLLLWVTQFVQRHTAAAVFVIGLFILALFAWVVFVTIRDHKPEEKKPE